MLLHNLITYKVAQFLNHVLALRIELQNALFEEFEVRLESNTIFLYSWQVSLTISAITLEKWY
jgi:hypothetical protein